MLDDIKTRYNTYPYTGALTGNITPFTFYDGESYLEKLMSLKLYVNDIVDEVQRILNGYGEDVSAILERIDEVLTVAEDAAASAEQSIVTVTALVDDAIIQINGIISDINRAVINGNERRTRGMYAFHGRLGSRDTEPVPVVFVGTSTTGGTGASARAKSYGAIVASALASSFPQESGASNTSYSPISDTMGGEVPNGVVSYFHSREGGSASYVNDVDAAIIGAINPAMIVHLVQASDGRFAVDPGLYKERIRTAMNRIDSESSYPLTHVLISQPPMSTAEWPDIDYNEYTEKLRELATERKGVLFIDTVSQFADAGITGGPGPDPLNLVNSDTVHPSDNGHALIAAIVCHGLGISVSTTVKIPQPSSVRALASDSFSGNGDILGRVTDNLIGGDTREWERTPSQAGWQAVDGYLVPSSSPGLSICGIPIQYGGDAQVTAHVVTENAGDGFMLVLNAQSMVFDNDNRRAIASYNPKTGLLSLQRRHTGGSYVDGSVKMSPADLNNATVSLRRYRQAYYLSVNGEVVVTGAATGILTGGYAGFARTGGVTQLPKFSWIAVDAVL